MIDRGSKSWVTIEADSYCFEEDSFSRNERFRLSLFLRLRKFLYFKLLFALVCLTGMFYRIFFFLCIYFDFHSMLVQ